MLTITRKEACNVLMKGMFNEMSDEQLEQLDWALTNDVAVRDFMMTMPAWFEMKEVITYLERLEGQTKIINKVPINTVLSVFYYETDEPEKFSRSIGRALEADPNYSLARLIGKMVLNGLPPQTLLVSRKELKDRVVEVCYGDEGDFVIKEENG